MDIDPNLIFDPVSNGIRSSVLTHIDLISSYTGTDIFLLKPRAADPETAAAAYGSGLEIGLDHRYRVLIFGDMESIEHAKTRTLMMIDQIVRNRFNRRHPR